MARKKKDEPGAETAAAETKEEAAYDSEEEAEKKEELALDAGFGAFNFSSLKNSASVWMLPEDKVPPKPKRGDASFDWWGGKEKEFSEANTQPVKNDLPDPRELGIEIPDSWASKEWIQDRDFWIADKGSGLENLLKTCPFENYLLKKGCLKSNGKTTVRTTGKFKGLVTITSTKNAEPLIPLERVADYVARIYVWKVRRCPTSSAPPKPNTSCHRQAEALQPSDSNGKSDPYLKCSMGGWSDSGRKEFQLATLNPEFYKT